MQTVLHGHHHSMLKKHCSLKSDTQVLRTFKTAFSPLDPLLFEIQCALGCGLQKMMTARMVQAGLLPRCSSAKSSCQSLGA